jgi:hypothetical protein
MIYHSMDPTGHIKREKIDEDVADELIRDYILDDWEARIEEGALILTPLFHADPFGGVKPRAVFIGNIRALPIYERISNPIFQKEQDIWVKRWSSINT